MKSGMDNCNLVFKKLVCLVLVLSLRHQKVFSSPTDSLKFKIGALPSLFYTPETSLGFGGLVFTYFKTNKTDTSTKKSNTQSYLSYTLNEQFSFENDYQIWSPKNKFYFTGSADITRFPQLYYGIGNSTSEKNHIMMTYDAIRLQTKNFVRLNNFVYGGLVLNYQLVYNQDIELSSNSCMEVYGNMGFEAKGLGPILVIDKRDNPLNPAKGMYFEASYIDYKNILHNSNTFTSITIDARKYYTLFDRLIWNGNLYFSNNRGAVPYKMLSELGGARFLRGYYRGRFRDNNMIVIQQEFRMPVYKMFGIAIFGGIGKVSKTIQELKTNEWHYDYGVGLRVRLNKKENTNLRIDYGRTKDSQGIYVVFAEAF
ncbi:hypothetical protein BH10BAC1_BH10BAC1_15550 [soil metagenome]